MIGYWTTERIEMMRKLRADGLSASQIALEIGGVSRNAVIGKIFRLGLGRGSRTTRPRKQRGPGRLAPRPIMADKPLPACEPSPDTTIPLVALQDGQCRWPYGDGPFLFCGEPAMGEHPYCSHHWCKAHAA